MRLLFSETFQLLFKPLSQRDAMSSRLFCKSIRELVSKPSPNVRMGSQCPRKHLELVANGSPKSITVRQKSLQNNRQVIACFANPSPTFCRHSHIYIAILFPQEVFSVEAVVHCYII